MPLLPPIDPNFVNETELQRSSGLQNFVVVVGSFMIERILVCCVYCFFPALVGETRFFVSHVESVLE